MPTFPDCLVVSFLLRDQTHVALYAMSKIRQAVIKHLWWIIAIAASALLICHSLQIATITVDTTSLVLVVLILLSPFVAAIKRIKIGEFEAEIDPKEVKRVTEDVATKIPAPEPTEAMVAGRDHPAVITIRELAKTDLIVALAQLRIELEKTLRRLYRRSSHSQVESRSAPLHKIIRDLAAREVIPHDLESSIRDVVALCNRAIHGEFIRDEDARAVINAGAELLLACERSVREYGVAHPIEKATITNTEVEAYRSAHYRVVTIIPLVESPQRITYVLTHDELEDYFDGYSEFGEFVVSVEKLEANVATDR